MHLFGPDFSEATSDGTFDSIETLMGEVLANY